MKIQFDKLYRYDRSMEPCSIAVPVKAGQLWDAGGVQVVDGGRVLPSQTKITSRHKDGSVRFLFTRLQADLPGNAGKELEYVLTGEDSDSALHGRNRQEAPGSEAGDFRGIRITQTGQGYEADCGAFHFTLQNHTHSLFESLQAGGCRYGAEQFTGPLLRTEEGEYRAVFGRWQIEEEGPVCVIFRGEGEFVPTIKEARAAAGGDVPETDREAGGEDIPAADREAGEEDSAAAGRSITESRENVLRFECGITIYAGKPWADISFRLINTTDREQHIASFVFGIKREGAASFSWELAEGADAVQEKMAACASVDIFHTLGVKELPDIESRIPPENVRTCVGRSNYKTAFTIGRNGAKVSTTADAQLLIDEANEHFGEVFYGTFFADVTDEKGGVCATIFQAQQNFPKAMTAEERGISVMLVPEGAEQVVMASGMSREQRFQLHFHGPEEPLAEIDNRSLIYQMPDKPRIAPEIFREAGVLPDVFLEREKRNDDVEIALVDMADGHARCYGMMNWGDVPDPGYTAQGRGQGRLVWTNNEYDYPYAMYLMYARTGIRRFLEYANVAASHWMDVDVCHYSHDSLRIGGQWEHTAGHCRNGVMVCSHEWVEGLIQCWHFTGNRRALETALGIGENILRLLETPMYQKSGESNARETGWALRTLTALYQETWEDKWVEKCRWIVGHFKEWTEEYGGWLAPYTDNTVIRVGFMISVAVGSLMRYYRVFGGRDVREMILRAVNDLVENGMTDTGMFYYKELPSLARNGNNVLLLESLAIAYELTGEKRYLEYGRKTFAKALRGSGASGGGKKIVEDTVIVGSGGTKGFAQSFLPLVTYYKALTEAGMR